MNEQNYSILKKALIYVASVHGFEVEKERDGRKFAYSFNGYMIDKETYKMLNKANEIINSTEE